MPFSNEETVGAALRRLSKEFAKTGMETPEVDARFLIQGVLGVDAAELFKSPERRLGTQAAAIESAVQRRLAGEPVSRILGKRWFYGREFIVTPDVLDPRPDTECLIATVLEVIDARGWRGRPLRFADIGTGSGIVLVTLLAELPEATAIGTDVSEPALTVACRNAERHGVAGRAQFIHTRGLHGVGTPLHLVVSNPPYIPSEDIPGLARDVRDFDPRLALDGGPDGLSIYREIAMDIRALEQPILLVFEVGAGQSQDVAAIFSGAVKACPLGPFKAATDLGGHNRCVAMEIQ